MDMVKPAIGQNSNEVLSVREFDKSYGLKIELAQSMVYDSKGRLWISGRDSKDASNRFRSSKILVQRFDGINFIDLDYVSLLGPGFTNRNVHELSFYERNNGNFLTMVRRSERDFLFEFDPLNLQFTPIEIPIFEEVIRVQTVESDGKNEFFIIRSTRGLDKRTLVFRDDEDNGLVPIFEYEDGDYYPDWGVFHAFDDHFITSENSLGLLAYDYEGNLIKSFDQHLKNMLKKSSAKIGINESISHFTINDTTYFAIGGVAGFFRYEQSIREFRRVYSNDKVPPWYRFETERFAYGLLETRSKKVRVRNNGEEYVIERYTSGKEFEAEVLKLPIEIPTSVNFVNLELASRDIGEELAIFANNHLYYLRFNKSKFDTYLEEHSIRGILSLDESKYLVATEVGGWFELNLDKKSVSQRNIGGFKETLNRGFYRDSSSLVWSSFGKGIRSFDLENELIEEYRVREQGNQFVSFTQSNNHIYLAGLDFELYSFDLITKKFEPLTNEKWGAIDIRANDELVFMTHDKGLLVYDLKEKIYESVSYPEGGLMMIVGQEDNGILVSTVDGKLLRYDPLAGFKEVITDVVESPIASVFRENERELWLNTFDGLVLYDSVANTIKTFTENDGMSNSEANRFSHLVLDNGDFLLGTVGGLNHFNPSEIGLSKNNGTLELTSLSYYENGNVVEKLVLEDSDFSRAITLPAENRYFAVSVAVTNAFFNEDYTIRYKLNGQNWFDITKTGRVMLQSLAAGTYQLELQLFDKAGALIGSSILLDIKARQFFYKTWWFYTILSLLVIASLIWYVRALQMRFRLRNEFSSKLINAQESDRSRIAGELHDSIGQKLLVLKNSLVSGDAERSDISIVSDAIQEVREMSHNIHPFQFEKLGLLRSLENLINSMQEHSELFYSYESKVKTLPFGRDIEIFVFRMIQECIQNVEKHASATACRLTVTRKRGKILFKLNDNGQGFDMDKSTDGLGMVTLKDRAEFIKAELDIVSKPNKGTTIKIVR